jgi:hypothetical protein
MKILFLGGSGNDYRKSFLNEESLEIIALRTASWESHLLPYIPTMQLIAGEEDAFSFTEGPGPAPRVVLTSEVAVPCVLKMICLLLQTS